MTDIRGFYSSSKLSLKRSVKRTGPVFPTFLMLSFMDDLVQFPITNPPSDQQPAVFLSSLFVSTLWLN